MFLITFLFKGLLTKSEKTIFENLDEMYSLPKYWMPLVWAGTIVARARKEGRIRDDFAVKTILDTINTFRSGCGSLLAYDRMSIPLIYTQVRLFWGLGGYLNEIFMSLLVY